MKKMKAATISLFYLFYLWLSPPLLLLLLKQNLLNRFFIVIVSPQLSTPLRCCIFLQPLTTHTSNIITSRYL